jgi:hypothetical protein
MKEIKDTDTLLSQRESRTAMIGDMLKVVASPSLTSSLAFAIADARSSCADVRGGLGLEEHDLPHRVHCRPLPFRPLRHLLPQRQLKDTFSTYQVTRRVSWVATRLHHHKKIVTGLRYQQPFLRSFCAHSNSCTPTKPQRQVSHAAALMVG